MRSNGSTTRAAQLEPYADTYSTRLRPDISYQQLLKEGCPASERYDHHHSRFSYTIEEWKYFARRWRSLSTSAKVATAPIYSPRQARSARRSRLLKLRRRLAKPKAKATAADIALQLLAGKQIWSFLG